MDAMKIRAKIKRRLSKAKLAKLQNFVNALYGEHLYGLRSRIQQELTYRMLFGAPMQTGAEMVKEVLGSKK